MTREQLKERLNMRITCADKVILHIRNEAYEKGMTDDNIDYIIAGMQAAYAECIRAHMLIDDIAYRKTSIKKFPDIKDYIFGDKESKLSDIEYLAHMCDVYECADYKEQFHYYYIQLCMLLTFIKESYKKEYRNLSELDMRYVIATLDSGIFMLCNIPKFSDLQEIEPNPLGELHRWDAERFN